MQLSEIDRAVFENIRLELVRINLLPDINLYATATDFEAAKEVLRQLQADKQIAEVVGIGSPYDRSEQTTARITVDRKKESPGTIGGQGATQHEMYNPSLGVTRFRKTMFPVSTKDILYEVRLLCNSVAKERVLQGVLNKALGTSKVLLGVDENGDRTSESFVLRRGIGMNMNIISNNFEWMFQFTAVDVWVEENELVYDNIVPLEQVLIGLSTKSILEEDKELEVEILPDIQ